VGRASTLTVTTEWTDHPESARGYIAVITGRCLDVCQLAATLKSGGLLSRTWCVSDMQLLADVQRAVHSVKDRGLRVIHFCAPGGWGAANS
jgi:hypothetical protein